MRTLILTLFLFVNLNASAQVVEVGEVARDFEITDRYASQSPHSIKMSDYEGHVIVLDFFAWWCGPCRSSSPIVEQDIYEYFQDRDGNDHGVPVTVIAVNIESDNPDRTDQFVDEAGLKLVGNDFDRKAWDQFNERSAIPLFVIINGVNGNTEYEQWEVLYKKTGFEGVNKFREIINKVKPGITPPNTEEGAVEVGGADILDFREVLDNDELDLYVGPADAKWFKDLDVSTDGSDSLRTGVIPNHSAVWLETSVKGPGFVFFQWRTSNDYGQDFSCYLDDEIVSTFERGFTWEVPKWMPGLVHIPAGQHTLKWVYSKNLAKKSNIYGWLDNVQLYTEKEVLQDSILALGLEGTTFEFGGQGMWVKDEMNGLDDGGGLTSLGVGQNEKVWFQITVLGPGYMEFYYKTPYSKVPASSLSFYLDEKAQDLNLTRMSSSHKGWTRSMIKIPDGKHQARWSAKNNVVIDSVNIMGIQSGAPVIVNPPTSVEVSASESASFEVDARGYPFPVYQWLLDGIPLEGETGSILELNNLWSDHSGHISVVVSNEFGSVESTSVDLNVNEDVDMELAKAFDFDGRVVSMGKISEGWSKVTANNAFGGDAVYSFEPANRQGISNIFAVRVEGPGYMKFKWRLESILRHSEDSIECYIDDIEDPLVFLNQTATAESSEWNDNWIFIPSAYHTVFFVFEKNSIYPSSAFLDKLEFMKVQPGKPTFVDLNSNLINVELGESLILPIENADGFPFPNFQWQVNGEDIFQATESVFRLKNAWDFDAANYSVVLSNQHGSIKSKLIKVNVVGKGDLSVAEGLDVENLKFLNTGQSNWVKISASNGEGQNAVISSLSDSDTLSRLLSMVEGPGVLEFAWKIDGADFDGGRLSFSINDSEVSVLNTKSDWKKTKHLIGPGKQKLEWLFRLGANDIGEYQGYLDAVRYYTPKESMPILTVQPKGFSVEGIEDVTLQVEVEGWPIPDLQWFHDGVPINGANNKRLPIGMVWPKDEGDYWVVAKNSIGEVKSGSATIKIAREIDEDIGLALDTDIYFVVGGMGDWRLESNNTSDGIDAIKLSGLPLFDPAKSSDVSYATLTTQLDGPGELLFKLKIKGSHQIFRAYLGDFSLWNSDYLTIKDREINWENRSLLIPDGTHTVRLMFIQGGPVKSGLSSSIWIDELRFLKEEPPAPPKISIAVFNEDLTVSLNVEPGKTYYLETSTNLKDWDISGEYGSIGESIQFDLPLNILKKSSFFRIKTEH